MSLQGHELQEQLRREFAKHGTAWQFVFVKDRATGKIFTVEAVATEEHEDALSPCTHWIEVEEI